MEKMCRESLNAITKLYLIIFIPLALLVTYHAYNTLDIVTEISALLAWLGVLIMIATHLKWG
jgi:uncharacterized membrane protein